MSEIGMKLIAAVRAAAAANPDKVYEPPAKYQEPEGPRVCVNVCDGEGSCIVGAGALAAGIIAASYEFSGDNRGGIYTLNKFLGDPLTFDEVIWLASVQGNQDAGVPWGECIDRADRYDRLPDSYYEGVG